MTQKVSTLITRPDLGVAHDDAGIERAVPRHIVARWVGSGVEDSGDSADKIGVRGSGLIGGVTLIESGILDLHDHARRAAQPMGGQPVGITRGSRFRGAGKVTSPRALRSSFPVQHELGLGLDVEDAPDRSDLGELRGGDRYACILPPHRRHAAGRHHEALLLQHSPGSIVQTQNRNLHLAGGGLAQAGGDFLFRGEHANPRHTSRALDPIQQIGVRRQRH